MKAFLLVCLLASAPAVAEEVQIAVGMSYETAVANIKRCGGKDITESKQVAQRSGVYWLLQDYDIQIVTWQRARKIWSLSYWRREGKPVQRVKSLMFDTDTKAFAHVIEEPFVFVVAVHNVPLEGEPRPSAWDRASSILTGAGIRHSMESSSGIASVSVEPTRSREALDLIKKDAAEKGYWAGPAKAFQDVNDRQRKETEPKQPKPFVVIARIKDGSSEEFATMLYRELLKREDIEPTLESDGAGFRISVRQSEVEKAIKAIVAPPDLREKGITIKEEFLPLLK